MRGSGNELLASLFTEDATALSCCSLYALGSEAQGVQSKAGHRDSVALARPDDHSSSDWIEH